MHHLAAEISSSHATPENMSKLMANHPTPPPLPPPTTTEKDGEVTESSSSKPQNLRKRKMGMREDAQTVISNLDHHVSKRVRALDGRRRMGSTNDHYDILKKLGDSGTPDKVMDDIEEAVYELEARRVSAERRGALAWARR